ncbi:MAG: C-GCAxxG-C-C family protein [Deltaproteobacteria bacterium]|nr:C-GCAxxG-C-C family protein [Deltaproteobacteria bacterium]
MYNESEEKQAKPIHRAQLVLKGIRERTGIGDDLLERLSFVFDGGVGLHGGARWAISGAMMGLNLAIGINKKRLAA